MRKLTKRSAVVLTAGALVVAGAGGAYAYWSTSGTGTGTGSTAAGAATFSYTTAATTAMYPGDSAQPLKVTVKNTSTQNGYVAGVKAFITTDKTGCTGSDYLLGGSAAPSTALTATALTYTAGDLAPTAAADATSTIQFNNTGSPQDACKNAVVTFNYVAS